MSLYLSIQKILHLVIISLSMTMLFERSAVAADMARARIPVPGVKQIIVQVPGSLEVHLGTQEQVDIEAEPKVLAQLQTRVQGEILILTSKGDFQTKEDLRYIVTLRHLEQLKTFASGKATVVGFDEPRLQVQAGGSGTIVLKALKVQKLILRIADAGQINVSGQGSQLQADIDGAGTIDSADFAARQVRVQIKGSGTVRVQASQHLEAYITGAGMIEYMGNPKVSQRIEGAGAVVPVN